MANNPYHHGILRRGHRVFSPPNNAAPPATSAAICEVPRLPAIHSKTTAADPQLSSPLYDRVPPEIRARIFYYYFLEYTSSRPEDQYPPDAPYGRPNYTGKRRVDTAILGTCRRMYLETYFLPVQQREHVFWHSPDRAPTSVDTEPFDFNPEKRHFALMQPWQIDLVTEVHLFTQLFWLERGDCFGLLCKQDFMQNVKKLRITIRRGDWWWNERNEQLCLNPYTGTGQSTYQMRRVIEKQARGEVEEFAEGSWARFFEDLAHLEHLEFELETSDDKRAELEEIVKWAKTWTFPMGVRGTLKASEQVVDSEWRSGKSGWSEQCPYCRGFHHRCRAQPSTGKDPRCEEKARLQALDLGPMFLVKTMSWHLLKE